MVSRKKQVKSKSPKRVVKQSKKMSVKKESLEDGLVPIIKTGAKVIIATGFLGALGGMMNNE